VEVDPQAASLAARIPGLKIHNGELSSAKYPNNFFDVIVMWHVLEHISNTSELLTEIRRILKPDGFLVILVPNIASLEFKVFGINWKGLDLPRHLYHFSPFTLNALLTGSGFRVSKISTQIEAAILEASIRNLLNLERPKIGKGILWKLIRYFLWGLSFILAQIKASGIIVAYARPSK
jgi:SAM-dependent methyltransferase